MELDVQLTGRIFDIQGFSVHDGPGARSLVFMKGCSLNCFWCSNPEGISRSEVPLYYLSKCLGCGNCAAACTKGAIQVNEDGNTIDRSFCESCKDQACIAQCYTDALRISGRTVTVDELFSVISRDRNYWGENGGVTFSGGEPLLQAGFITRILEKCYNSHIHTAIETCGQVPWENFELTIGYLDWIFFDLKHFDSEQHKNGTGQGNANIIRNLKKLNNTFTGMLVFRLPLIPGYNDTKEDLEGIAKLILETKWKELNILPVHHLGREKYKLLGMDYRGSVILPPSSDKLIETKSIFEKSGITCFTGYATPF